MKRWQRFASAAILVLAMAVGGGDPGGSNPSTSSAESEERPPKAARQGCALSAPDASLAGEFQRTTVPRGTEGSNLAPSTGEMVWGRRRGNGTIVAVAN
jgi:hypothetical protein